MEEQSWKIISYGKDGDINKVAWLATYSDGTTVYEHTGTVPIETSLSSSSSEQDIVDAVKAQLGAVTLAAIQAEADQYKIMKLSEDNSSVQYTKSSMTTDQEGKLNPYLIVTNFDLIIALQDKGHYDTVNNWVNNSGSDKQKLFWKISPMYTNTSPLLDSILGAEGAGLTSEQQAEVYEYASKLTNYKRQ